MVYFIQIERLSFQKLTKITQTKKQIDQSNRLACGYSIIYTADIYQFLSLSMLRQVIIRVLLIQVFAHSPPLAGRHQRDIYFYIFSFNI